MSHLRDALESALGPAYRLEQELSGGGMSRVFVADDTLLGRKIVVKALPYDAVTGGSIDRFGREIALAARLQHPHIVPLLSSGQTADGIPFYTMPFVKGESLAERLTRTRELSINEGLRILRDVAAALSYAHGEAIVHRDIKPANVILSGGVAVVTDFGVAKALYAVADDTKVDGRDETLTLPGLALGTPAYMSPEQASADPKVDHRADIYSFGAMAYEIFAGAPPFSGRTQQQLLAAHATQNAEPIARRRPTLPAALSSLVMRCLEKNPGDRPQSADEIVRALDDLAMPASGAAATSEVGRRAIGRGGIAAAAFVFIVLMAGGFIARRELARDAAPAALKSVAVLPFTSIGTETANDYFSEGLTEEITDALAKLPGLQVPARSLSAAAAAREPDVQKAGARLRVQAVVSASVQHVGDRVRISAQLINVSTGYHIWAGQYDGELRDVFAVQDSIVKAIVGGLRVTLAPTRSGTFVRAATEDPVAHTLYLQGRYLWSRRTRVTIPKAIEYFERAVARDSSYAEAYAGIALAFAVLPDYHDTPAAETIPKTITAARRALSLDSTLADAYAAISNVEWRRFHNAAADSAARQAIRFDSTNATAWHWYALYLDHVGKMDAALAAIRRARALDPSSLVLAVNVGFVLFHARRYAEAESTYRAAILEDPTFPNGHRQLSMLLAETKRYDEAISEAKRAMELSAGGSSADKANLAYIYARAGRLQEAKSLLARLLAGNRQQELRDAGIAAVYAALGDMEQGLLWLKRAVNTYDPGMSTNSRAPMFDKLRADPRGAALFAQVEST